MASFYTLSNQKKQMNKASGILAIIKLILLTGLRTHEVINANVGDIRQFGGQAVLFILGKGRSEKDELVVLKLY